MDPRGEHDTHDTDEDEPAEERIEGGEEFHCRRLHAIDRSHAAQNHRRVEKRVEPGQFSDRGIAHRTDADGDDDDESRQRDVSGRSPQELPPREKRMVLVLVQSCPHASGIVDLAARRLKPPLYKVY